MSPRAVAMLAFVLGACAPFGCGSFDVADATRAAGDSAADASTDSASTPDISLLDGAGPEAPIDAGLDAGCAGHFCGGVCVPGASCAGCADGALLCRATLTCVSTCAACQPATQECWHCETAAPPAGSCEPGATAFCLGTAYQHCSCAGDAGAATCPGTTQTCVGQECRTCGAPATEGVRCRDRMTCDMGMKSCQ